MEYEVVRLPERRVAGLSVRTGNREPDCMQRIGGLWQAYFGGAAAEIPGKEGGSTVGVYFNYESDVLGKYDVLVGCPVKTAQGLPARFESVVLPAGPYAKFSFVGDATKDTGAFWSQVWQTPLKRAYSFDFEEYPPCADSGHAPIYIYIALAEDAQV